MTGCKSSVGLGFTSQRKVFKVGGGAEVEHTVGKAVVGQHPRLAVVEGIG